MSTNNHRRPDGKKKVGKALDRRALLKAGGILLGVPACGCGLPVFGFEADDAASDPRRPRWGMAIDVTKCDQDCSACASACRRENNLPPLSDETTDVHFIRKVSVRDEHAEGGAELSVPLLCNHCDNPPCVQVCPVRASYQRPDGIVMCDPHRCIGCRYCLIACPYDARQFMYVGNDTEPTNPNLPKRSHGVSTACSFCAHLVDRGEQPACVTACEQAGHGALVFGDLNDPDSEISRLVAGGRARGLREDLGTEPKVYYTGL
jgi:molybdopterin-containing oxidoreductase family iron-sulfur binding subunit